MSLLNIKRSVSWHENEAWNIRTKNTFLQEVLLSYHKLIIIFWSGFSSLMCQNIGKYFYVLTPSNGKMIEEVYITPKSSPLPSDSPLPLCPARMKNYFPINFVNFLTRGKSRQKWAKKLLKENTALLCCLLCSLVKKQNIQLIRSFFLEINLLDPFFCHKKNCVIRSYHSLRNGGSERSDPGP